MTKKQTLPGTGEDDVQKGVLLLLQVPRSGEHSRESMTQLLESLHELLTLPIIKLLRKVKRERISLEITAMNGAIGFYVWVPEYLKSHIIQYVHTQYPLIAINQVEDYLLSNTQKYASTYASEVLLPDTAQSQSGSEGALLKAIVDTLATLQPHEAASMQLLIRPAKSSTKQYESQLRAVYHTNLPHSEAALRMQGLIAPYRPAGHVHARVVTADPAALLLCRGREFAPGGQLQQSSALAHVYHLPHAGIASPRIMWLKPHGAQPPEFLLLGGSGFDTEVCPIGSVQVRGEPTMFGLRRSDRSRHIAVLGETGVGKSSMLELLAIADIYSRHGMAVIDTEGTLSGAILRRVPRERASDVVFIDFTDTDYPPAFNPLDLQDPSLKMRAIHELVLALQPLFAELQPPAEMLLRQTLSVLIDAPETTLLDIPRFLNDKPYRSRLLVYTDDIAARSFWQSDFPVWSKKNDQGAVSIVEISNAIQKIAQEPWLTNILGQPSTSFSVSRILQQHGILLVRCRVVEGQAFGAQLLGSLVGVSVHMATLARAEMSAQYRQPFYVYIDEAQAVLHDDWPAKMHEARRFAVGYAVSAQPSKNQERLLEAAGSKLCFRVAKVQPATTKQLGPDVMGYDVMTLANRQFVASVSVDGAHVAAFTAISLTLPELGEDLSQAIIGYCRGRYNSSKTFVENYLKDRYGIYVVHASEPQKPARKPKLPKIAPKRQGATSSKKAREDGSVLSAKNPAVKEVAPKKRKASRRRKKASQLEHGILRDMELLEKTQQK